MIAGIGTGALVLDALLGVGIRSAGWQWIWAAGAEGGVYEPHRETDRRIAEEWDPAPGDDLNRAHCRCYLKPVFRDERTGRFARALR